jgi:hypothetical protein
MKQTPRMSEARVKLPEKQILREVLGKSNDWGTVVNGKGAGDRCNIE